MNTAADVQKALRAAIDHEPRLFKDGPGEYAHGDKFLGVTVPNTRVVAKQFPQLPLAEIEQLLNSEWHDDRLCALFILVQQYAAASKPGRLDAATQKQIYDFYLAHTARINNWDLVDASAYFIVGPYLADKPQKMSVLTHLASSKNLWERRIAIVATLAYARQGSAAETVVLAEQLLYDQHDLIQKAVGWALREMGAKADRAALLKFLDKHAATMPRTTLRYAVEHLPPEQRLHYMGLKG